MQKENTTSAGVRNTKLQVQILPYLTFKLWETSTHCI